MSAPTAIAEPICLASVHSLLLDQGLEAVLIDWPELEPHRPLLDQVLFREERRQAAEQQARQEAAAIQRLLDQVQLQINGTAQPAGEVV